MHIAMGKLAGKWSMVKQLDGLGLLGADTTYIHSCYFSDEEWELVAKTKGTISIAPQVEMQMGHGWPPVQKARSYGLRPSLSIDVVTTVPGDMFTEMRCAFGAERWRSNDSVWESEEPLPSDALTARDMLTMATLDGAYVAGLEARTGSLTPGKQADVVVIDGSAPGTAPIIDPIATVVLAADTSNVDTVIIGGRSASANGKLTGDWASALKKVEAVERLPARRPGQEAAGGARRRDLPPPGSQGRELDSRAADAGARRRRVPSVGRRGRIDSGAVHTGFGIVELAPGGRVPWHVHSYEDSLYVLEGEVVVDTGEGANLLRPGDYGVSAVGAPHALRNIGDGRRALGDDARRRSRARAVGGDTYRGAGTPGARADADRRARPTDAVVRPYRRREHGGRPTDARTCSRCRPACGPRCWSTAGSP